MKVKTKLIASIMSICLVCAVFAIGVFALKTANLKIGGDVSFQATGVEADIKNVTLTGATTDDQVLATGSINTSMTQADIDSTFQNWQSLKLDFDENATDIELKFQIANTSTNADNYIEIDYSYSFSNSSPNVDVFPGDENAQSVWENNEYILTPKGSAETATYKTFTLKFKVLDKELNVPQDTRVSVNIELKHITPVNATGVWNFVANSPKAGEATLQRTSSEVAYTTPENWNGVLEIPAVITDGTNNYIVTKLYSQTGIDVPPHLAPFMPNETTNVKFSNGLKEIEGKFYGNSPSLYSLVLPKSLTSIGAYAFYGSTESENNLNSIFLPNSIVSIGDYSFDYLTNLASITIPSSVTSIGVSAFSDTPWYNNQSDGLIYINNVLYKYKGTMPAGTSIEVKEGTVSISDYAFLSYSSLTTITIPSSVTSIGNHAFNGCGGLTTITIPSSVTSIGNYAFHGCGGLTTITIPSTVTSIGDEAFRECTGLTTITIPSSVTSIGAYAFYSCSSLNTMTIPSGVTSIGIYAFSNCTNLTSVKFEETTGWSVADSADGARTPIAESEFTTDASAANANLLKTTYSGKYWFRTVA